MTTSLDPPHPTTEPTTHLNRPAALRAALLLSAVGFITQLTEVLPAGVLPSMARDLGVSESLAGQSVAVFALGSIVAAIPLSRATAHWDRRTLVLLAISVSIVANIGTALAPALWMLLVARFVAGLVAGVVWATLLGYTRGFTEPARFASTLGVVLAGATLGFAVGVPVGTFIAGQAGWRAVFLLVAGVTVVLGVVAAFVAPRVPGVRSSSASGIRTALRMRPVLIVLGAVAAAVIAQGTAYTYIAPVLAQHGTAELLSLLLGAFGVASVVGTLAAGRLADSRLAPTVIAALALGAVALAVLFAGSASWLLLAAAACWGLAYGAFAVLFQVAIARVSGTAGDAAQSAVVTVWNLSIATGGGVGGVILATWGAGPLLPMAAVLMAAAIPLTIAGIRAAR